MGEPAIAWEDDERPSRRVRRTIGCISACWRRFSSRPREPLSRAEISLRMPEGIDLDRAAARSCRRPMPGAA